AAQAMDDVPIVDDVPMPSLAVAAAAAQGQCAALTDEAFQPVVVQPYPQAEADQARGHRVEHLAQDKAAAGGHEHGGLVVVGGSCRRQLAQGGAFQLHHLAAAGIAAADEVGDPGVSLHEMIRISLSLTNYGN